MPTLEWIGKKLPRNDKQTTTNAGDIKTPRLIQFNYSSADFAA